MVVALGVLAGPGTGRAASPAQQQWEKLDKDQRKKRLKKAKRYVKKAKKAYTKQKWDDAIAAFELAYNNVPTPKFLFNIGRCYEKAGDLYNAMDYTQQFVDLTPAGEEREDAEEMAEMLQQRLKKTSGELSVVSSPPGATVRLTGESKKLTGKTPFKRWLEAGEWKLKVTLTDHKAHEKEISIALGEAMEALVQLEENIATPVAAHPPPEPAAAPKPKVAPSDGKATSEQPAPPVKGEVKAEKTEVAAKKAEAPDNTVVEEPEGDGPRWAVLAPLAAGAALVAGGVVMGAMASVKQDELDEMRAQPHNWSELEALHDDAESKAMVSNVLYAAGGVAAVAGVVLWLTGDEAKETGVRLQPTGLMFQGSF